MKRKQTSLDEWFKMKKKKENQESYVQLPNSKTNTYKSNGKVLEKWYLVKTLLSDPIESILDLIDVLKEISKGCSYLRNFDNLLNCVSNEFIKETLPEMQKLTLRLPELFPDKIPLLRCGMDDEITFTKEQIACLLCNAFFCTFPKPEYEFPQVNFYDLYQKGSRTSNAQKLLCLLNYFEITMKKIPSGKVTFIRQVITQGPNWKESKETLCPLDIFDHGNIEDSSEEYSQIDFANKTIGGGVLRNGCVQEEIRFIISPECIISRLFMQDLGNLESIIIIGSQRYSSYSGYGDTFKYEGPYLDTTKLDEKERTNCEIIAIDAIDFKYSDPQEQFKQSFIDRELNKSYCGFFSTEKKIATGLWGCGVFLGNKELKSIIQLMSASHSQKKGILFYTFGNEQFSKEFKQIYKLITSMNFTVSDLYQILLSKPENKGLFDHIRDSIIYDESTQEIL